MQSGKFRVTQISSSQSQRPVHIRWNHRETKYYCIRSEISLPRFQEWSRRGTAPRKRDTRQRAKRIESGRREDGAGRRRRQVGRPLWDYRNGKCGWTHLDSLRAHELSLSLSRSICKSVHSTSSRGELPSRLSVHASHVHTRCQPRCRTSRAGAWRFINRYASPGKATTTAAAINPFRAKLFFRHVYERICTFCA